MEFYPYQAINVYNAAVSPSTVHVKNTGLANFFKRYLFQKIVSNFKFENLPETWSKDYFSYILFGLGFIAVVDVRPFGVIPQFCTLSGYNVFYEPTNAVISNPLIKGFKNPRIGVQCELIKMQPDYMGAWDIVDYYGDLLALCAESAGVNLLNTKLAYVFAARNAAAAASFKKMYDDIASGEPATVVDKQLFDDEGRPNWEAFNQNLKQTYIAGDIMQDMAMIESQFNTLIGVPNVNIAKQSGVSAAEVNANDADTNTRCSLWLETIREGLRKVNKMFGLNIKVELNFAGGVTDEINYNGALQLLSGSNGVYETSAVA